MDRTCCRSAPPRYVTSAPASVAAALVLVLAIPLALVACSSDSGSSSAGSKGSDGSSLRGTITVSAAASLTDAYTEIAKDFEAANPGTTIDLNFDSSGTLAEQITEGAPADVFASASTKTMGMVVDDDRVEGTPEVLARNELAIVTKPGNPTGIATLDDLAAGGVIALCADAAPCGSFADEILGRSGVSISDSSITRGQNVKSTLTAVTEGDATAAIVYVTDALAAGDRVDTVTIPADADAIAEYPVAVLAGSENKAVARSFVEAVASAEGQKTLASYGFLPPS